MSIILWIDMGYVRMSLDIQQSCSAMLLFSIFTFIFHCTDSLISTFLLCLLILYWFVYLTSLTFPFIFNSAEFFIDQSITIVIYSITNNCRWRYTYLKGYEEQIRQRKTSIYREAKIYMLDHSTLKYTSA